MSTTKDYKEVSRLSYGELTSDESGVYTVNHEIIKIGCLQRIADGVEKFAEKYDRLEAELKNAKKDIEFYQSGWDRRAKYISKLERQLAGYKGALTRANKQIKELKTARK